MPRLKKSEFTSEELTSQLAEVENEITTTTATLKELKNKRKKITKDLAAAKKIEAAEKEEQDVKELLKLMDEKGLSIDDIKGLLE